MADRSASDPLLARAVAEVGDGWTLLIAWAIANGVTRFDALQRELGVARNILSERLRRQIRDGIVEKRPISDGARRMEYRLTAKGDALAAAIESLRAWAEDWSAPASSGEERARRRVDAAE